MPRTFEASCTINNCNSARGLLAIDGQNSHGIARIISAHVTHANNTTSDYVVCSLQSTTGTTTGAGNASVQAMEPNSGSPSYLATNNITSEPSYGGSPVGEEAWNSQAGYHYEPYPEERFRLPGNQKMVLRLLSFGPNNMDIYARLVWEEEG